MKRSVALAICLSLAVPALASAAEAGEEISAIPKAQAVVIPAIFTLIVFILLVALLGKTAWGPIAEGLQKREDKIRGDVEAAEAARAEAEKAREDYRAEMAGAEARIRELMAQAQADGQQLATRIKMQAQEDAEEIKERANREIEQNRRDAVEQIRTEAAELAVAVAEKILRREVTAGDQSTLVNASLDELEKTDVATA